MVIKSIQTIGLLLRWMTEKQQKKWRRDVLGRGKGTTFREMMRHFNASEHIHIPSKVVAREEKIMLNSTEETAASDPQDKEIKENAE